MSKFHTNTNRKFLPLIGASITVPMETVVTLWETGLDVARSMNQNAPLIVKRVEGLGRAVDAALIAAEVAPLSVLNSNLPKDKQISLEDWRDSEKREQAIVDLMLNDKSEE